MSHEFGGGGKRTAERALQNHFWRSQKLGLVWSAAPLSFKGNDRESPKKGGETYRRWGVQKRFWGGFFSPNLRYVFPPPEFSTPLGRSLTKCLARSECVGNLGWSCRQRTSMGLESMASLSSRRGRPTPLCERALLSATCCWHQNHCPIHGGNCVLITLMAVIVL